MQQEAAMSNISINRRTLALFWRFTKPNEGLFWMGTVGAALGVIVQELIPPFILAQTFNRLQSAYSAGGPLLLQDFKPYLIAYVVCALVGIILWRTQVLFVWKYETYTQQRIAEHIFDHLQRQGARFHANRFGGALVSNVNKFISAYERVADEFTWSITTGVVAFVGSMIVLSRTAPVYAIVLGVISSIYFIVMFRLMKLQAPYDRRVAVEESTRTAKVADTITNIASVRAFANERHELALFHKQTEKTKEASFGLMWRVFWNDMFSHTGTATIGALAFIISVVAVTNYGAPVGTLYLAVSYTMGLTRRLWESGRVMRNINRSFGDAGDMTEILELEPEVLDPAKPQKVTIARGEVRFNHVDFGYPETKDELLFKNLDFKIKPGEKVGLVGHSGGGKTTVTQLMLRFMEINDGTIEIDGQDISKITQADLRRHIAYVAQEPLLFHRTLRENIAYGNKDADMDAIKATAKLAHAHEFIEKLPEGYDTLVGERGVKLSGGQRQRIAIARAMLKNAPILVLDEATSALDSESESLIQDALWKLMQNRTAIVIAHRLSTIQKMDRILVMSEGKIVEQGSHKELILQGGVYADLWAHQSGGFMED